MPGRRKRKVKSVPEEVIDVVTIHDVQVHTQTEDALDEETQETLTERKEDDTLAERNIDTLANEDTSTRNEEEALIDRNLERQNTPHGEKDKDLISLPPRRIIHQPTNERKTPRKTPMKSPRNTPGKKKRKTNSTAFVFSPEQEKDIAEWFRENPIFYNKRSKDYRLTQIKRKKIEEKAKEIKDIEGNECSAEQLMTWMTRMRTYFGKLSKEAKSGSGTGKQHMLTEREIWIKETFTFLSDHIHVVRQWTELKTDLLITIRNFSRSLSQHTDPILQHGLGRTASGSYQNMLRGLYPAYQNPPLPHQPLPQQWQQHQSASLNIPGPSVQYTNLDHPGSNVSTATPSGKDGDNMLCSNY